MTLILAILGALFGGLVGAVLGFVGFSVVASALGTADFEGARSMVAALLAAPIGAVAGAILGCLGVVHLRRKAEPQPMGVQGWAALGITVAGLAGLYVYLFHEPPAPTFAEGKPRPILTYEIRLPAGMVDASKVRALRSQLRTYQTYLYPDDLLQHRIEGDAVILTAQHTLSYTIEDRALELWLNQSGDQANDRLLIFDLPYGKVPEPTPGFSDWRPVDHVRSDTQSEDITVEGGHDIFIRTRISR